MTIQNATYEAAATFRDAQQRVLDRYQVPAQSRFVEVPSIGGRAQVVVAGEGPPLPMVIGGAILAVFWAPLMAEHSGHTLDAIELPVNGFTDRASYHHTKFRSTDVAYLADILDALEIGPGPFVTQSMGSARPPRRRDDGWPREYRGVDEDVPGLYFCWLLFQYTVASCVLPGVGHDAAFVAQRIHHHASARAAIAS